MIETPYSDRKGEVWEGDMTCPEGDMVQWDTPIIKVEWGGVMSTKTYNISETVKDRNKVTMMD